MGKKVGRCPLATRAKAVQESIKLGLCEKAWGRHLAANVAKQYFERTLFLLILLRKINKNSVRSKFPFAAEGGGTLCTQPQHCLSTQAAKRLFGEPPPQAEKVFYIPQKI